MTYRAVLDEDTPGGGAHYCISCSRYFVTGDALEKHAKTKPHKRRYAGVMLCCQLPEAHFKPHAWQMCSSWPNALSVHKLLACVSQGTSCRLKELQGAKPHNKRDAEWAAGMGKPDNGAKQQPAQMEQ